MKSLKTLRATSFLFVIAAVAFGSAFAPAAHADVVYQFTYDGCSGGCGPQNSFGTVTLSQVDSNTVDISVTLLNTNAFVTTGSHAGFAFNFLGGDVTVGTLPTGWSDAGANVGEPSFGNFAHGIDCDKGNSNSKSGCAGSNPWDGILDFKVSRTGGLSVSDFRNNSGGYAFAVDILSGTTSKTGVVAAGLSDVPEPGTLAMMGTGVLGLAGVLRRATLR